MCEYSGRLIAWLDRELPDAEATNVEWHVGHCADCRKTASAYEEVSGAFLACYEAAMVGQPKHSAWTWAALGGVAAAAAILLAVFLALPRPEHLPAPRLAVHAPVIAFEKTPPRIVAARGRRIPAPEAVRAPWVAVEPTVEVELPADALFPPGAVPEGFSFIANVRPWH
jgi:hypothetical protein